MASFKSKIIRARIPENCAAYLDELCKAEDKSLSEIIRLIINERMLKDRMGAGPSKFQYYPAPTPRGRPASFKIIPEAEALAPSGCSALRASPTTCERELITSKPDEIIAADTPEIIPEQVSESPQAIEAQGTDKPLWGPMDKPVYPGTLAEYEDAIKHGQITKNMFKPPIN